MAGRIRTLKPELRELAEFAALSDGAARLFLMLYTLVDDAGRCPAGASFLSGAVFFAKPRSAASIGRLISELERASLVSQYAVDGSPFIEITGWRVQGSAVHQRISKPQPTRYPAPESNRSAPKRGIVPHANADGSPISDLRSPTASTITRAESGSVTTTPSRPPGEYDPEDPRQRGALAERVWRELDEVRRQVAHELDRSAPFPLPVITPHSEPRGFRDLRDRIREEGALAPRVCAAILKRTREAALESGDPQWLDQKLFGEGAWKYARAALEDDDGDRDDKPSNVIPLRTGPRQAPRHVFDDPRVAPDPMVDEAIRELMAERGGDAS